MQCRHCGSSLARPGDFCLVCRKTNADTVVLELGRERATVTTLEGDTVVGSRTVTTTPETDGERVNSELRSFAGQIADETRRKRPDSVYAGGNHDVLRAVRAQLHFPFYRVEDSNPVAWVQRRSDESELAVVDEPADEKIGGSHSTVIGDRSGRRVLHLVAAHPNVKKIIPGPIDAGGSSSQSGVRAKVTRADERGNVRLLVRDGSSVQENRIVTTAGDRERGEVIRDDLNEALEEAEFH